MTKILLAEDDVFIGEIYATVLKKEGFDVRTAVDGEEALALARNNTDASLMLLDIMMPKLNGVEVLKQLKADPQTKELPIILLTNLSDDNIIQEALHLGAVAYLIKVRFTPQAVVEKIREFLEFKTLQ
jgi:CheY-like chemotaxis protein